MTTPDAREVDAFAAVLAEHDDLWFNGTQPPNDRDFGCICATTPLGHTPEDDYEAMHADHVVIALLTSPAMVEHDARVAAAAWDDGFMNAAGQDHPAYPRTRAIRNPYTGDTDG